MKYCEFIHDYKDVRTESQITLAKKGERGVLDGYTSGPTTNAIVIKDNGEIVVAPPHFIRVRYITEGGERGCEKFFDCYYDNSYNESLKNNSENEK